MNNQEEITVKEMRNGIRKLNPAKKKIMLSLMEKLNINLIRPNDEVTRTRVRGFCLEGKKYEAEWYIDVLRKILNIVFTEYHQKSNKILLLRGRKNKYFSKDPNDLRMPEQIKGSNIYFETNENGRGLGLGR